MTERKKFQINSTSPDTDGTSRRFTINTEIPFDREDRSFRVEQPENPPGVVLEPLHTFSDRLRSQWRNYTSQALDALSAAQMARDSARERANQTASEQRREAQNRRGETSNQIAREREQVTVLTERLSRLHSRV